MSETPQGITPESSITANRPKQTAEPSLGLRFEMSASIGSLIAALAKARKQFSPIIKSEVNPFFKSKYADLAAVIEATKDGLSDNGLAVLQLPAFTREAGLVEIKTILAHASGEWISTRLDMPIAKTDAQSLGSAVTYGRRYSYSSVLNVASETDDDGSAAVSGEFKRTAKKEESPEEFDQRTADQMNIGPAQIKAIDEALKASGKTEEETIAALAFIGEKRIEHIKKNQFDKFLKWAIGKKTAGKGPAPEDQARMKANKKLWALAAEHSIPEHDVKQCAYEKFHVESMTQLSASQLEEMTEWVKSVAEAVQES